MLWWYNKTQASILPGIDQTNCGGGGVGGWVVVVFKPILVFSFGQAEQTCINTMDKTCFMSNTREKKVPV